MNRSLFRYRIVFTKTAEARFIGHLDLQSLLQKAIRRAGLPVAYSEGFNPHQLLSFAAPLSLGMAALGEIVEVYTTAEVAPRVIMESLNPQMPKGITVLSAEEIPSTGKGAAALVLAATYDIIFPFGHDIAAKIDGIIAEILASDVIKVQKRTKKGLSIADIRPDILNVENLSNADEIRLQALLSTGSARNLKPEVLVEYILDKAGVEIDGLDMTYTRLGMILSEGK